MIWEEEVSAITSAVWAAVARVASRQAPMAAGTAPQLTIMRSFPIDSSKESVPAWAPRSSLAPGGAPQSMISTDLPACNRWKPLSFIALGPRVVRPAWVSARSISAALSSLLLLNSASPPSPWRRVRSAGATRSIAGVRLAGGVAWAAWSRARMSVRSCSTASNCAGLRSQCPPSGRICRLISCGSTRNARERKAPCSGSATAAATRPRKAVKARASSSSGGMLAASVRASATRRDIRRWRNPSSAEAAKKS